MEVSTLDIVANILKQNVEGKYYEGLSIAKRNDDKKYDISELPLHLPNMETLDEFKIVKFHSVPIMEDSKGNLIYDAPISLLDLCSESIDIMKLVSETLGFRMQLDPVTFLDFLFILNRTSFKLTNELKSHIIYCTENVDQASVVEYLSKVYPALLPGEALYVYIFGDIRDMADRTTFNMRDAVINYKIDSWRPFGILLLTEHINRHNKYIKQSSSPVRICLEYLSKATENITLDHAPAYFLLGMSDYSDMVNGMKIMSIIPRMNYRKYLTNSISKYKHVLNRNYGTTIDIRRWNESQESRDFFFKNTIAYSLYNDMELLSTFGVGNRREVRDRDFGPVLPKDFNENRWRFSYFGCNDNLYIAIGETGEELVRQLDLKEDIIIAYGTFTNHRCWTASLISDFFDLTNMQIQVPGYLHPDSRDETYPQDSLSDQKYFSEAQIIELYLMLSSLGEKQRPDKVVELLGMLQQYIDVNVNGYINDINVDLNALDEKYEILYRWFLNWCLLLSLYTRRWKGVGYDYPYSFREAEIKQGEAVGAELCSVDESVYYITGQIRRYRALMDMKEATTEPSQYWDSFNIYFGDYFAKYDMQIVPDAHMLNEIKKTIAIIEKLHVIEIDNGNLKPMVMNGTDSNLSQLIDKFTNDNVCSPHLSDILRSTAVYHFINTLGNSLDGIDGNLRQFLIFSLKEYGATEETIKPILLNGFFTSGHFDPEFESKLDEDAVYLKYLKMMDKYSTEIYLYLSEHAYFWSSIPINEDVIQLMD